MELNQKRKKIIDRDKLKREEYKKKIVSLGNMIKKLQITLETKDLKDEDGSKKVYEEIKSVMGEQRLYLDKLDGMSSWGVRCKFRNRCNISYISRSVDSNYTGLNYYRMLRMVASGQLPGWKMV